MKCVYRFWGEFGVNGWPEGSKLGESLIAELFQRNNGVKREWVAHGFGVN